jgi:hypothetical protein
LKHAVRTLGTLQLADMLKVLPFLEKELPRLSELRLQLTVNLTRYVD